LGFGQRILEPWGDENRWVFFTWNGASPSSLSNNRSQHYHPQTFELGKLEKAFSRSGSNPCNNQIKPSGIPVFFFRTRAQTIKIVKLPGSSRAFVSNPPGGNEVCPLNPIGGGGKLPSQKNWGFPGNRRQKPHRGTNPVACTGWASQIQRAGRRIFLGGSGFPWRG